VLATQFVNSALHLAQPLLIAKISGSMAYAAFFASFDTAMHMFGTYCGGWPTDRFGARRVLVASTFLRGVALTAVPLAMVFGQLTALWAVGWYTLDAFVRGFVDASVNTIPMELAEHDAEELDRLNSRYELVFDIGGVAGPLSLYLIETWFDGFWAHALIPAGFALSALAYSQIPASAIGKKMRQERKNGGSWAGLKTIVADRKLLVACLGLMSFNIYPLRKLLGAFFAKGILLDPKMAGLVGSAFGAGGVAGAVLYTACTRLRISSVNWILAGSGGMLLLAIGWWPASLYVMVGAVFTFAVTNVGARLSLTRVRQEFTPLELAGGVTAASRFGSNLVSVLLKALVGVAFTMGAGATEAFALVGFALALIAFAQLLLARYLSRVPDLSVA
jgi:MFS family permease